MVKVGELSKSAYLWIKPYVIPRLVKNHELGFNATTEARPVQEVQYITVLKSYSTSAYSHLKKLTIFDGIWAPEQTLNYWFVIIWQTALRWKTSK